MRSVLEPSASRGKILPNMRETVLPVASCLDDADSLAPCPALKRVMGIGLMHDTRPRTK